MTAIGAQYKWVDGKIYHAARLWKSPTKRRIPRMLIEDRALKVGILMYVEEPWMVFEETKKKIETIQTSSAIKLHFYKNRYHLLPATIDHQDTYEWLKTHKVLLFGKENRYYILPS